MIKNLVKDLVKYSPAVIVPAIIGIIALPIITRLFSPEDYGNYILVVATITVLTTIIGWLSMSVIRFYPFCEKEKQLPQFYSTVILWSFISTVVLIFIFLSILFLTKPYFTNQLYSLMLIGILVFILTAAFEVLQSFLRAKRQIGWYVGFSVWKNIVALIIGISLVMVFNYSVEGLFWGITLAIILAMPFLGWLTLKKTSLKIKNFSSKLTKEMAKYSFPLVVGNLAAWILSLSDRYMLEFLRGGNEVGIYSVSYGVSEYTILLITLLFAFAFNPLAIIIWEKKGKKKSQEFLYEATRYFLLLCIPAVVGISVLKEPIINILTVPEYYEGAKIIPWIALGGFFLGLQQRFGAGLSFYKKTTPVMLCIIASGLLNIGLNILLIPKYGYMAAAVTTLVSYAFLLLLIIIISRRFFVWPFPFTSLLNATIASLIMGGVMYSTNFYISSILIKVVIGLCLGAIAYFIMLFLLKEPKKEEILVINNFKNRALRRIQNDDNNPKN